MGVKRFAGLTRGMIKERKHRVGHPDVPLRMRCVSIERRTENRTKQFPCERSDFGEMEF